MNELRSKARVLEAVENEELEPAFPDARNFARLVDFFEIEHWGKFGFAPSKDTDPNKPPKEWTPDEVLKQLEKDVAFGFEKALNQRGLSASAMFETVKMWMWIFDDPLQDADEDKVYTQYGLPYFKAVAVKYGFPNPIGDDEGNEDKYAA